MKCSYCRFEFDNNQAICPNCGAPAEMQVQHQSIERNYKNAERFKAVYIWAAILFGGLGVHDFYAGYHLKGCIKIVITLTIIGIYISWIWAIIDACTIRKAKSGELFI